MRHLFRLAFGIDLVIAAIVLFFFALGIADGSVSDFNIGIWLLVLSALAMILGGGYWLSASDHVGWAIGLLLLLAVPGLLFALFMILVIGTQTSWN